MGRKRYTQESFIEESTKVHGGFYDYSKVEFSKVTSKVTIICPVHGEFNQLAGQHKSGRGCRRCASTAHVRATYDTDWFIQRSVDKFGDRFEYEEVDYLNEHTPIVLVCKKHGRFETKPVNHLSAKNGSCPECTKNHPIGPPRLSEDDVWEKMRKMHGNTYEYLGYVGGEYLGVGRTRLRIVCKRHGEFEQALSSHMTIGHGCRFCGYDALGTRTRESYTLAHEYSNLYLLEIINNDEHFLKVGITTDMKTRMRHLKADIPNANVEVLDVLKLPAGVAWDTEKAIHNSYTPKKYVPKEWFGGGTECYAVSELDLLTKAFNRVSEKHGRIE